MNVSVGGGIIVWGFASIFLSISACPSLFQLAFFVCLCKAALGSGGFVTVWLCVLEQAYVPSTSSFMPWALLWEKETLEGGVWTPCLLLGNKEESFSGLPAQLVYLLDSWVTHKRKASTEISGQWLLNFLCGLCSLDSSPSFLPSWFLAPLPMRHPWTVTPAFPGPSLALAL